MKDVQEDCYQTLFIVMLACIPMALIFMSPPDIHSLLKSFIAAGLFASNILFWRESGYFNVTSENKPLLHTWSLAVEGQFYLLFPLFLILVWRFGNDRVFWMLVVMAVISLLLSEWCSRYKPLPNFYLAPTRAWELLFWFNLSVYYSKTWRAKKQSHSTIGLSCDTLFCSHVRQRDSISKFICTRPCSWHCVYNFICTSGYISKSSIKQ